MRPDNSRDAAPNRCTNCEAELGATFCPDGDKKPSPGDYSVCIECGHLMVFADDLTLRDPNDKELIDIAGDNRLIEVLSAVNGLKKGL